MFAMFFVGLLLGLLVCTVIALAITNLPRMQAYLDKQAEKSGYNNPPFNLEDKRQAK